MKPIAVVWTTVLLTYASLTAGAAEEERLAVSMPAPRESRKTFDIAPASTISRDVAWLAATKLSSLVPGTLTYAVAPTGSMRPLFDANATLLAEPASFESLQVGDIILFEHSRTHTVIVHRILERRRNGYWTMGDNNDRMDDELVTPKNYRGRVYGIIYAARSRPDIRLGGKDVGASLMAAAH